jgi:hypothetical protein
MNNISRTTAIGRNRTCSCCGGVYKEWKEQDIEGHNCQRCTVWILRREVIQKRKSIELLCSALNEKNQAHLRSLPFRKQRIVIAKAFEKGHLTWKIG